MEAQGFGPGACGHFRLQAAGLPRSPHRPSPAAPGGVGQRCEPAGRADGRRVWRGRAGLMTSMGRGHALYGTDHWSDGAWTVKAHGSIGDPAGASARAGRGCTASCTARATVHRWAARAGLQGCRHRRRTFVRWCRAPRKRGRGCARNGRGCVMGGVSKENGAKDCAVEAAAPLPTPELRGAEQQRVGLTLGAAQL